MYMKLMLGGNLASAPALMGNVVLWKPSDTAILSSYIVYQVKFENIVSSLFKDKKSFLRL